MCIQPTLFYCILLCFVITYFYKLEVCGRHVLNMFIKTTFPSMYLSDIFVLWFSQYFKFFHDYYICCDMCWMIVGVTVIVVLVWGDHIRTASLINVGCVLTVPPVTVGTCLSFCLGLPVPWETAISKSGLWVTVQWLGSVWIKGIAEYILVEIKSWKWLDSWGRNVESLDLKSGFLHTTS